MISEERLRQAAIVAGKAYTDSIPAPESFYHNFSPAFERKMRRVLRRGNHPVVYRVLQRVAGLLLTIVVSGSILLSVNADKISRCIVGRVHIIGQNTIFRCRPSVYGTVERECRIDYTGRVKKRSVYVPATARYINYGLAVEMGVRYHRSENFVIGLALSDHYYLAPISDMANRFDVRVFLSKSF